MLEAGNLKVQADIPPGELAADTPPGELAADIPPGELAADIPPGELAADTPPGELAGTPQLRDSRLAGSLVELVEQQPLMIRPSRQIR